MCATGRGRGLVSIATGRKLLEVRVNKISAMADSTIEEEGKQVEDVTTTGYRTGTSGTFKSTTSDSIITELLPSSDLVEKSSSDSVEKSEKKSSSDLVEEKSVVEAAGSEDIVFNSKKKSIIQHPLVIIFF